MTGKGVHIFVFVDDFLVIGDTREDTVRGMEALEALFEELGLQWAAHKRRGPARAIEFLGFLLVNDLEGAGRFIGLTKGRRDKVARLIKDWMARRPSGEEESLGVRAKAEPKELASLLARLLRVGHPTREDLHAGHVEAVRGPGGRLDERRSATRGRQVGPHRFGTRILERSSVVARGRRAHV